VLGDPSRGPCLEALVGRLKRMSSSDAMRDLPLSSLRLVAVSATVPNLADLGRWLGAPDGTGNTMGLPSGVRAFGDEHRPCRLRTVVRGYTPAKNDFLFEKNLNTYLLGSIMDFW
jgi:ATP-dependent DNA helicase HFM1/MER3